jgi:hypothetical protein
MLPKTLLASVTKPGKLPSVWWPTRAFQKSLL